MLELTHKNHFKFGFNRVPFSRRLSADDQWFAEFGQIEREPGTFKQECIATAKLIGEKATGPIWLLFSGGIDSEVMLQSFVEAKVPFNVAINRFANNLNIHDVSYAVIACERLQVPYKFFELDIEDFWRTKFLDYIYKSDCCWPALTPTMWLMEQVPGYPVLGSGECFLDRTYNSLDLEALYKEITEKNLSIVFGNRMSKKNEMPRTRFIGNWLYARLLQVLFGVNIQDACTGFRIFKRELTPKILALKENGLNFSIAFTVMVLKNRLPFSQIPIQYDERIGRSKLSVVSDGFLFLRSIFSNYFRAAE